MTNSDSPWASAFGDSAQISVGPLDQPQDASQRMVLMVRRNMQVRERIERYVESHLCSAISTRELASIACVSVSQFHRVFRKRFGSTPAAYVRQHRVRCAQRMMLESAAGLAWISLACGFYDQAHFSRTFHRLVGMSPSEWRRRSKSSWPANERSSPLAQGASSGQPM